MSPYVSANMMFLGIAKETRDIVCEARNLSSRWKHLLVWKGILTKDKIMRIGWILVNRCFMCKGEEESIEHILRHCSKERILGQLVFSLLSIAWVLIFFGESTLLSWNSCFVRKQWKQA